MPQRVILAFCSLTAVYAAAGHQKPPQAAGRGIHAGWRRRHSPGRTALFRGLGGIVVRQEHCRWTIVAALAASTSTIELGQLVMCVSFRSPALLAKMAVTADGVSGGRLVLGLGAGWYDPEYLAFCFPAA